MRHTTKIYFGKNDVSAELLDDIFAKALLTVPDNRQNCVSKHLLVNILQTEILNNKIELTETYASLL